MEGEHPLLSGAFALFETAIGWCGVAWGRARAGVQLPEGDAAATRARVAGRFPDAREQPPPLVGRAVEGMAAVLRGEDPDLSDIALDMGGLPGLPPPGL